MKTLIIVKSIHRKSTEKIAKVIASRLDADIIGTSEYKESLIDDYDVIGFGSGIYMQKHHKEILKAAKKLPDKNKKVFIFSTTGSGIIWRAYHYPLRRILKKKGCSIIGEFSCRGFNQFGPFGLVGGINKNKPNEEDLNRAKIFADSLRNK